MRLFKREFVISVQMNSYSPSPPNRTHNYCTMRVTSSRVHVIYKKRHVSVVLPTRKCYLICGRERVEVRL